MRDGILILGAGGFLGDALSQRLIGENRKIHRLLRTPSPLLGTLDTIHLGDLGDISLMQNVLSKCDTVFHLASSTTPGSSARKPSLEADLNLLPTLRLLETMQDFPGTRVIFVSSGGTIYGNPEAITVKEIAPLAPLSYHGAGKIALETFMRTFSHISGNSVTVLRPSNLYGPDQKLRSGFGLIRTMLEHVRRGSLMEIWGNGESVRDFLYIDDMVEACCLALADPSVGYRAFNVGVGNGHSINQVRALVEQVSGKTLATIHHPQRTVDVRHVVLDYSKINADLGWTPKVSLTEGIHHTWQWLQSHQQ